MLTAYLVGFTLVMFFSWTDLMLSEKSNDTKNLAQAIVISFSMLFIVVMLFLKLI